MLKKTYNIVKIILVGSVISLTMLARQDPNLSITNDDQTTTLATNVSDPTLSKDTQCNELENFKNDSLKLGQAACFFSTHGEDPYFEVIYTDIDESKVIKCGCYDPELKKARHVKDPQDLANIIPLRYTLYGFGGNYKTDIKYKGERKTFFGKTMEKLLLPDDKYEGTLFIDEYNEHIPMFWILENVEELRALSTYILEKFTEQGFVPEKKTLLVLKIKGDPELKTLNETDTEFLQTYFELFPLTDEQVKKFFTRCKKDLIKYSDLENPKYVGETTMQGICRDVEKFYKDFEFKRLVILVGAFVATKIIYDIISNEINDGRKKIIQRITKDPKATSLIGALMTRYCS